MNHGPIANGIATHTILKLFWNGFHKTALAVFLLFTVNPIVFFFLFCLFIINIKTIGSFLGVGLFVGILVSLAIYTLSLISKEITKVELRNKKDKGDISDYKFYCLSWSKFPVSGGKPVLFKEWEVIAMFGKEAAMKQKAKCQKELYG